MQTVTDEKSLAVSEYHRELVSKARASTAAFVAAMEEPSYPINSSDNDNMPMNKKQLAATVQQARTERLTHLKVEYAAFFRECRNKQFAAASLDNNTWKVALSADLSEQTLYDIKCILNTCGVGIDNCLTVNDKYVMHLRTLD